jgi:hypothetical protein
MNTANLENCKRLYELSGWTHFPDVNDLFYVVSNENELDSYVATWHELKELPDIYWYASYKIPAYDAGYLLRKLPNKVNKGRKAYRFVLTNSTMDESWIADYLMPFWQKGLPERGIEVWLHYGDKAKLTEAEDPENALCKLMIQLFEEGILTQ